MSTSDGINLLLHLLFEALFTSAQNRMGHQPADRTAGPRRSRDVAGRKPATDRGAHRRGPAAPGADARLDRQLHDIIAGFGLPLTPADFSTIRRFHHSFVDAGLSLKFESRGRPPRSAYPTLRDLLLATDRAGRSWNYLASERDFQFVRSLQTQDLVIPVVGDLGGQHALAAIADLLVARGDRLSAFYISNVETYLYGDKSSQFVKNVNRLPRDAHSVIIRSIFIASISSSEVQPAAQFLAANRP